MYLDELKKKSNSLTKEAKVLEEKFRRVQSIKRHLSLRGFPLEVLDGIYNNIPEKMRLTEVVFDRQATVFSLKGVSDTATKIIAFSKDLSQVSYFQKVKLPVINQDKIDDKDVQVFSLTITLADN